MQLTSSAVSCIEYTAREWDIYDTAYMAGYRAAREDAAREDRQKAKIRGLKRAIKRERSLSFIKQKVIGFVLILMGFIIPLAFDGDATASPLIILLGAYMVVTRNLIISDRGTERFQELTSKLQEEREVE